jgi:metal-sulfur cluster biosynthetic enzyme
MDGVPKENENPKVFEVDKYTPRLRDSQNVWSAFNSISVDDDGFQIIQTSTHGSVLRALHDVSDTGDRRGISLLTNSGLVVSHRRDSSERYVCRFPFHLSDMYSSTSTGAIHEPLGRDEISEGDIFEIIRNIQDPEHPLTLEQLGVVSLNQITKQIAPYNSSLYILDIRFTPTIPHCSMATLIGLAIRVKLLRSLPNNDRFKVTVRIEPGTHNSEASVNKQLSDKERVCAALENKHLLGVVNKCIASGMKP